MSRLVVAVCVILAALVAGPSALQAAKSCEALASLAPPSVNVTPAEVVPAGTFTLPQGQATAAQQEALARLPAVCRVAATLQPSSDSDIKIEVWMPATGWNRKLVGVGNGGWSGSIGYPAMLTAIARGYATT